MRPSPPPLLPSESETGPHIIESGRPTAVPISRQTLTSVKTGYGLNCRTSIPVKGKNRLLNDQSLIVVRQNGKTDHLSNNLE
jgi:hypothetical protein